MPGAWIELERETGYRVDKWRAYEVLVDNVKQGRVRHGESLSLEVEPGSHTIRLRVDWCLSNPVVADVGAGERARLSCRPNATPWTILYHLTFGLENYIQLSQV